MLDELLLTFLLLFSGNPSSNILDDFLTAFSLTTTNQEKTYLTEQGTYFSLFYSHQDAEKEGFNRSTQTSFCSISNKYIIVGENDSHVNANYMKIGNEPMLNINGESNWYKTAYKLDISNLPDYNLIFHAGLMLYRYNGTIDTFNCYQISDSTYDSLTGVSTYSSTFVSCASLGFLSNYFNINLTEQIITKLENEETCLSLIMEGTQSQKMGNFYTTNSFSCFPILYVEYASTLYGNALAYEDIEDHISGSTNCVGFTKYSYDPIYFDYAFSTYLGNSNYISYDYLISNAFPSVVTAFDGSSHVRLLANYNSPVYQNERRIAFRVKLDSSGRFYDGNYHFVCQCADGSWACKFGTGDFGNYPSVNAPETNNAMWYNWPHTSDIIYFAYKEEVVS